MISNIPKWGIAVARVGRLRSHARHFRATPRNYGPPVDGATDISHSHFLSHASPSSDFNPNQRPTAGLDPSPSLNLHHTPSNDANSPHRGHLTPTSSHLFKLILPLPTSSGLQQTAFLLHPSQPLSHLSRLIVGSLPPLRRRSEISYLALTGREGDVDSHLRRAEEEEADEGRQEGGPYLGERSGDGRWQEVSWSQSTDLSDFIKQSCLNEKFKIVIAPEGEGEGEGETVKEPRESEVASRSKDSRDKASGNETMTLEVVIPSFASRTTYLRARLLKLTKELDQLTKNKKMYAPCHLPQNADWARSPDANA